MPSLTKDSVQFSLDVYTRYSINCDDDKSVESVLNKIRPIAIPQTVIPSSQPGAQPTVTPGGPDNVVNAFQLYEGIIRPALGEAVRESVSSFIANEVNANREVIFKNIKESVLKQITDKKPQLVNIIELNLSNLDFPDELDKANVARAEQAVLKDKAIAERDRVDAEVETANKRKALVTSESNNEAARIDALGAAYRRNPEYVQLESIRVAAEKGNLIIAHPGTGLIIQHK
jgi:regulator of protease activity HflC (stomatin/prohibitin superfamily)